MPILLDGRLSKQRQAATLIGGGFVINQIQVLYLFTGNM